MALGLYRDDGHQPTALVGELKPGLVIEPGRYWIIDTLDNESGWEAVFAEVDAPLTITDLHLRVTDG